MVVWPAGFRIELLERAHARKSFDCGEPAVNEWLKANALQNQNKRLSSTRVLLAPDQSIAGFYTLAIGQVDFSQLPAELVQKLPRRALPVAVLAWLGIHLRFQQQGLGDRLFAQALTDCHAAGQTFAFVAVILDCLNERAKAFYRQWDFEELPGYPNRLYLAAQSLDTLMKD